MAVELGDRYGPLVICLVGTGLRPGGRIGLEWRDVDLGGGTLTVRRAFAKGRLKDYTKTQGSTRRIPLRRRVVDALEAVSRPHRLVFQSPEGGYININNFRSREWKPALEAAGVAHVGFTICGTRTPPGASQLVSTSLRLRVGWARA